ncbi:hypothetical protein SB00610_02152 [Klebsiella quasipneumoniae subsp. similipneumoniae]|nr:hypothetical protein SB00610_02152 [Klebsiella quasipneumoniae subsp. similipneumoniae]
MSENNRPGHLLLANSAIFLEPQHQQQQVNTLGLNIQLQRQRVEDRFAKAIQQREFVCQKIRQQTDFLIAHRGRRLTGSMDQVVAQGVKTVTVKLDIEAFFQAIILLPHLMGDQQQHLRATGILVIKDQPIEEGFNLLPHASLRLFPDRFFIQHRFMQRQNPTLNVIDQPLNRVARPQQPDQAGLRLD